MLATVILLAATNAMAAPPEQEASASPSASTGAAAAEPQEEKKICRTEKVTGSLTRRSRICLTAAQWQQVYDRTRKGLNEMASSASGAPRCISAQDVACGAPSAP